MHSIGFWHEHSRPDRDDYVTILKHNVIKERRHNFNKVHINQANMVGPYDVCSIMHYPENDSAMKHKHTPKGRCKITRNQ